MNRLSEKCLSPVCENAVVSHPRAVWKKQFCSIKCKLDACALRRAAKLLGSLGPMRSIKVLEESKNGRV